MERLLRRREHRQEHDDVTEGRHRAPEPGHPRASLATAHERHRGIYRHLILLACLVILHYFIPFTLGVYYTTPNFKQFYTL